MTKAIDKFKCPKFAVAILTILSGTVGLLMGTLSGGNFVALVGVVAGLYEAGQSAVEYSEKRNERS